MTTHYMKDRLNGHQNTRNALTVLHITFTYILHKFEKNNPYKKNQ